MSVLSMILWGSLYVLAIVGIWAVIAAIGFVIVQTIREGSRRPHNLTQPVPARAEPAGDPYGQLATHVAALLGWGHWDTAFLLDELQAAVKHDTAPDVVRDAIRRTYT